MWVTPGQTTDIQSPLYQRRFVSKDIQDASYLRLRNLNLSYDFSPKVFGKIESDISAKSLWAGAKPCYMDQLDRF